MPKEIKELKLEDLVEYAGEWHKKGKDGNCEPFAMADLRELIAQERQKWVEQLKQGKICHNCGAEKENDLSDWCPKCMEEE